MFGQSGTFQSSYQAFNERIRKQVALMPNRACVITDGLSGKGMNSDADGYRQLGKRNVAPGLRLLECSVPAPLLEPHLDRAKADVRRSSDP